MVSRGLNSDPAEYQNSQQSQRTASQDQQSQNGQQDTAENGQQNRQQKEQAQKPKVGATISRRRLATAGPAELRQVRLTASSSSKLTMRTK